MSAGTSFPPDAIYNLGIRAEEFSESRPMGVALPGTARPGFSAIYKHGKYTNVQFGTDEFKTTTAYEAFNRGLRKSPTGDCLGHRPYDPATKTWGKYVWQTYEQVAKRRDEFGAGLVKLHENSFSGKLSQYMIGIFAKNRPEWAITDFAAASQSIVSVALYDTLGADSTEYIINHSEIELVVCSVDHVAPLLLNRSKTPKLRVIVSMDPLDAGETLGQNKHTILNLFAKEVGVQVLSFEEVEELGRKFPRAHNVPSPDDIWTVNYTSGTTGNPKGAVLQHKAVPASAMGSGSGVGSRPGDIVFSCLPLAHCYQRSIDNAAFFGGTAVGYFHGDMLSIIEDMQLLKPTLFPSVPRILSRFAAAIRAQTIHATGVAGAISRTAYAAKKAKIDAGGDNTHIVWDRVWCAKIQRIFGGRLRTIVSGSAPISKDDYLFLQCALGCNVLNGYGLTETNATANVALPGDCSVGHCGPPMPLSEFCLRSVPSMDYTVEDKPYPRGELLIRAPNRVKEYLKDPVKTAEAITSDGWFCTGDIFVVDHLGRFGMIDRVKNFFKLAQGEYVSPERIENMMLASTLFTQLFIHGNSEETFLVAIGGVNPDEFAPFASKILGRSISNTDLAAVKQACDEPKVVDEVIKICSRNADKAKLQGFERIKRIYLTLEPFTFDNDLVTPTLKVKRAQAAKYYKKQIDAMYASKGEEKIAKL
ncbi:medium-chain fatty acid-CoA ligase faa2 [Savitreella phatthalungensis]